MGRNRALSRYHLVSIYKLESTLLIYGDYMPIRYLRQLPNGILILWCYLIWYLVMASFYFVADGRLWLNSVGIALIVGTALILATGPFNLERIKNHFFQVMRLVLCPFFVSSFSALTKGKSFFLLFSPILAENLYALLACTSFILITFMVKRRAKLAIRD
mgnify:CR=1 FL=1